MKLKVSAPKMLVLLPYCIGKLCAHGKDKRSNMIYEVSLQTLLDVYSLALTVWVVNVLLTFVFLPKNIKHIDISTAFILFN